MGSIVHNNASNRCLLNKTRQKSKCQFTDRGAWTATLSQARGMISDFILVWYCVHQMHERRGKRRRTRKKLGRMRKIAGETTHFGSIQARVCNGTYLAAEFIFVAVDKRMLITCDNWTVWFVRRICVTTIWKSDSFSSRKETQCYRFHWTPCYKYKCVQWSLRARLVLMWASILSKSDPTFWRMWSRLIPNSATKNSILLIPIWWNVNGLTFEVFQVPIASQTYLPGEVARRQILSFL